MAKQKVVVITGSSSGFGLLTAIEFARDGYRVVATMRDLVRAAKLEEAAKAAAVRESIELRRLDITEFDSLAPAAQEIARHYGHLDVLVNNAGFSMAGLCEDIQLNEIRQQFETNFFGSVAMTKAVLPIMRHQHSGHIIQISSVAGRCGQPMIGSYAAAKFALEGWSEALRIETRSLGIRVSIIEPGAYDTDIWNRNVRIAQNALSKKSPNKARNKRFAEYAKSGIKKGDPRDVARLILHVANDPHPNLRYIAGAGATLQVWLRALAPWHIYERIVAKAAKLE